MAASTALSEEPPTDQESGAETSSDFGAPGSPSAGRAGLHLRLGARVPGVLVAAVCGAVAMSMSYREASSDLAPRRAGAAGLGALGGAELRELSGELQAKFGVAADVPRRSWEPVASEDALPAGEHASTLDFLFVKADVDGSGFVEGGELAAVTPSLMVRFGVQRPKLDALLKESTRGHDGRLGPECFKGFLLALSGAATDQRTAAKFRKADRDHSGFLEGKEILPLFKHTVKKLLLEKASSQQLLAEADKNTDGKLSLEEYEGLLGTLRERFPSRKVSLMKTILFFFQVADADKSGLIEGEEKEMVERALKEKFGLTDDDYRKLAGRAGPDDKMELKDLTHLCLSLTR